MSDHKADPAQIERDLDQTRSRLGDHLSQLQERLSPGQVLDDLMGYFRGSEGAEFGRSLLANVRDNPLPAALTGIGLAWLMASNARQATSDLGRTTMTSAADQRPYLYGSADEGDTITRVREAEQGVSRHPDEPEHDYSARLDEARGHAIGLARHVQESTTSFGARVQDALAAARTAVASTAVGARDQVGSVVGAAGDAIGSMTTSTQNAAQSALQTAAASVSQGSQSAGQVGTSVLAALTESPVLLGALGLAAGALLGALLPQSDQEEAALGGIAGRARDAATGLANEGVERGRSVAQTVSDAARTSAREHGLTGGMTAGQLVDAALSGDLASGARDVAHDVLDKAGDAVRTQIPASDPTPGP